QAVVVPAHRVEHLAAAHPLEARGDVGVGVGEHVPDVQRAADGRRRGVDREDVLARAGAVEGVGALLAPALAPALLEALEAHLVRDLCAAGGRGVRLVRIGAGHVLVSPGRRAWSPAWGIGGRGVLRSRAWPTARTLRRGVRILVRVPRRAPAPPTGRPGGTRSRAQGTRTRVAGPQQVRPRRRAPGSAPGTGSTSR